MKHLKLMLLCFTVASQVLWTSSVTAQDTQQNPVSEDATAEAIKIIRSLEKHLSGKSRLTYETELTSDVVLDNGQKIQIAGTTHVYFKRPNQLLVKLETDSISRLIYHDGEQLTIISPNEKYYGIIEARTSSIEALMSAAQNYGLEIPLVDLIGWGAKDGQTLNVESAVYIGESTLQGKTVDHWAFRGPQMDWEAWVTQGDDPLPLKISTVSYHAYGQPRFTATIKWNDRTSLNDSLFTPKMDKGFRKIPFKQLKPVQGSDAEENGNE
ncbi:DUF2092 domain-containing protein [Microbulbifer mangrovi]|uniref:DUF2092 domain-containing protein n=1 Tax=Microbulbifer mangrovi TaxID=927787 RepID=UPI0009904E65|nr:DUF2092 domain-containing protein [Microbulbifer mangrovi]